MSKSHPRWRLAKKILTWLFFIAVIVLLVVYAKKVDWEEVWKVIRDYNRVALLSAVGLVVVSNLIYGCYDLLARFYCGHKLAKRQVMLVSFICYAFNLTLSTWVGGIGMRYRLYSRLGLPGSTITRIFSLSITTNWLGYILLAGIIFTAGVVELPDHWYVDQTTLRILGIGLLMIIAVYLWFCCNFAFFSGLIDAQFWTVQVRPKSPELTANYYIVIALIERKSSRLFSSSFISRWR